MTNDELLRNEQDKLMKNYLLEFSGILMGNFYGENARDSKISLAFLVHV